MNGRRKKGDANSRSPAFTLLELLLVLAILAVVCGAASLQLGHVFRSANGEQLMQRLGQLDELARARSRQGAIGTQLVFQLDKARAFYREYLRSESSLVEHGTVNLGNCRIEQVRIGIGQSGDAQVADGGSGDTAGEVTIDCSSNGYTPSYCLTVLDGDGKRRWLLVVGLTGVARASDDPTEANNFIASAIDPSGSIASIASNGHDPG